MPRTQREAGIDWRGWEGRLHPQRPWLSIIAITLAATAGSFFLLALCAWGRDALLAAGWIQ